MMTMTKRKAMLASLLAGVGAAQAGPGLDLSFPEERAAEDVPQPVMDMVNRMADLAEATTVLRNAAAAPEAETCHSKDWNVAMRSIDAWETSYRRVMRGAGLLGWQGRHHRLPFNAETVAALDLTLRDMERSAEKTREENADLFRLIPVACGDMGDDESEGETRQRD